MEFEQILQLIDHVSDSKLTSFQYESDSVKLSMKCGKETKIIAGDVDISAAGGAAVLPLAGTASASATEQESSQTQKEPEGNLVKSPLVGTFYAAPAEDAEPFVKVGDHVKKGQILAIVEAMKLMNEIESDFDGEVAEIYVENAQAVEYGQPLFRIR
ncbi:MAG: acetyl-CoA carboxylase biotin carboxyl carrier protein [Otoolea sp.]|nr:acetyl-CoA carboxylase biotin carboxyl carrier protein [Blautia sp.]MDY3998234.1 acetyl-CoA carboxylase biotin carboxyl carrier protein [Blautia sp.]